MTRDSSDTFPLVFGVIVSTLLAGTLVIAGLKAGITPGVSPLVILFAWGAFSRRLAMGGGSRFLNIAQVAGSAGMAVTAGVIFTAPLVQILHADKGLPVPPVDVTALIILSIAGSLIGFGFVGLGTRQFLTDPTLPAPEARACETMIDAAVADRSARPKLGRSLGLGALFGALAPLAGRMGLANEHVVLMEKQQGERAFTFDLPMTPIYIGIGGLLTLATALLVFGGSMLRLVGDYLLADIAPGSPAEAAFPPNSMRWVGGAAMTVAVAYSLVRFLGLKTSGGADEADEIVSVDPGRKRMQSLSIAAGIAIMLGWIVMRDGATSFAFTIAVAVLACCGVMVLLGAILSLQIGSSASPVSGTVFVTALVLCATAVLMGRDSIDDVLLLTPLLVGACVAVCTANDASQDYKTMQLCGVRVQDGFLAQFIGLLAGSIVVPIVLYISHEAYTLGSEELTAPQGQMFATLIDGLMLSDEPLPWMPITWGLGVGVAAVLMEILGSKKGLQLPSMALAVGIYLPPYLGVGILIGSLFRWMAEGRNKQSNESILAAAGLITGAALLELVLGTLIVGSETSASLDFKLEDLEIFAMGDGFRDTLGLIGILVLGGILWSNSRNAKPAD